MSISTILNSIVIYVIVILVVGMMKPNIMYDHKEEEFKEFGFTKNKTPFTIIVFGAIISFIIYNIIFALNK